MAVVKELIRKEENGKLSFGDYSLDKKAKLPDFEYEGDLYKVKTFKEITKLEKNGMFVYESVPGTSVEHLKETEDGMEFKVEGPEDAQITVGLEADTEYEVFVGGGDAVKETPKEPKKVETLPVRCPDELEEAAITPTDTEAPTEAEPVVVKTPMLDMTELSATFNGWFTPEAFLGWIAKLPIPEAEVKIRVSVTKRGEAV